MKKVQVSKEELDAREKTFRPIDLTETNVNAIYGRCLFVKDGVNFHKVLNTSEEYAATNCQSVRLLMKIRGFSPEFESAEEALEALSVPEGQPLPYDVFASEDEPVYFNVDRLRENQKSIAYLFGQLEKVHTQEAASILTEFPAYAKKYSGKSWVSSSNSLAKLFYLGSAAGLTGLFAKRAGKTCVNVCVPNIVKPTLSPQDPAFKAWWEEHKAEWDSKQLPEIR